MPISDALVEFSSGNYAQGMRLLDERIAEGGNKQHLMIFKLLMMTHFASSIEAIDYADQLLEEPSLSEEECDYVLELRDAAMRQQDGTQEEELETQKSNLCSEDPSIVETAIGKLTIESCKRLVEQLLLTIKRSDVSYAARVAVCEMLREIEYDQPITIINKKGESLTFIPAGITSERNQIIERLLNRFDEVTNGKEPTMKPLILINVVEFLMKEFPEPHAEMYDKYILCHAHVHALLSLNQPSDIEELGAIHDVSPIDVQEMIDTIKALRR